VCVCVCVCVCVSLGMIRYNNSPLYLKCVGIRCQTKKKEERKKEDKLQSITIMTKD